MGFYNQHMTNIQIDARDGRAWDALMYACTRNLAAHSIDFGLVAALALVKVVISMAILDLRYQSEARIPT